MASESTIVFFQKNYILVAFAMFISVALFSFDNVLRKEEDKLSKEDFGKIALVVGILVFASVYLHKIDIQQVEQILTRPPNL
jgi:hypothetical protein